MRTSGDMARNEPIGSSLLFWHFQKCIRYSKGVDHKISNTILTFPNGYPLGTSKRTPKACRCISQRIFIHGKFLKNFLKIESFSGLFLFKKDEIEKFKNH
jgi:hypothetical protein